MYCFLRRNNNSYMKSLQSLFLAFFLPASYSILQSLIFPTLLSIHQAKLEHSTLFSNATALYCFKDQNLASTGIVPLLYSLALYREWIVLAETICEKHVELVLYPSRVPNQSTSDTAIVLLLTPSHVSCRRMPLAVSLSSLSLRPENIELRNFLARTYNPKRLC